MKAILSSAIEIIKTPAEAAYGNPDHLIFSYSTGRITGISNGDIDKLTSGEFEQLTDILLIALIKNDIIIVQSDRDEFMDGNEPADAEAVHLACSLFLNNSGSEKIPFQSVLLNNAIKNELKSQKSAINFYLAAHIFDKSFKLSKQHKPSLADYYMDKGERFINTFDPASDLYRWSLIVYLPKKSYFVFKQNNWAGAKELVEQNIAVLRELIGRGYDFLIFFLVQQTHNMARLYFSVNRKIEALTIIGDGLRFLYGLKTAIDYFSGLSLDQFKTSYPQEAEPVIYAFINQLTNESLTMVLKNEDRNSVRELLSVIFSGFDIPVSPAAETKDIQLTKCLFNLFDEFAAEGDHIRFIAQAAHLKKSEPRLMSSQMNLLTAYMLFLTNTPDKKEIPERSYAS